MSSKQIAQKLNEEQMGDKTTGVVGLIVGIAIKYGLPSVCCIWLFYVIWCKDQVILNMTEKVTTALVESSHSRSEQAAAAQAQANALRELSDAVKDLNQLNKQ